MQNHPSFFQFLFQISPSLKMEVSSSSSSSSDNNNDNNTCNKQQKQCSLDDHHRLYLVPFRWWNEAEQGCSDSDYGIDNIDNDDTKKKNTKKKLGVLFDAIPASTSSYYGGPMKILNNIFKSDLAFNLTLSTKQQPQSIDDYSTNANDNDTNNKNGGDVRDVNGVSGRNYALVSADMWLQALKWHSDSKGTVKDGKSFSSSEDDMTDVYPLQLKLSILQEINTLGVRINKKDNAVECFRRACKIFSIESELLHIWDFSGQTTQFLQNDKDKNVKEFPKQSEQDVSGYMSLAQCVLPWFDRSLISWYLEVTCKNMHVKDK